MLSRPLRMHTTFESAGASSSVGAGTASALADAVQGAVRGALDAGALARLAELDPTGENRLVDRVLQAFQTSVARLRPQFDAARRSGDHSAIRLVVHTLKSSSASIGALALSRLCAQIESVVRGDAGPDLSTSFAAFDLALDDALHAIDALLKERA